MAEITERCPMCQVATNNMRRHNEKYHPILATESAPPEITERDREMAGSREARIVHEFARTHAMDLSDALDLVQHLIPEFAQARAEGYAAGKASRDAEVHKMAVGVAKLDIEVQRLTQRIAELEFQLSITLGDYRRDVMELQDVLVFVANSDTQNADELRDYVRRAALAQKGGE